jgi:hypothetical protein
MAQHKHFDPSRVGDPRYPLTQEAWQRQYDTLLANAAKARKAGKLNRKGIPNGYAKRRDEVATIREAHQAEAEQIVAALRNAQQPDERLDRDEARMSDDEMSDIALAAVIAIMRAPTTSVTNKLIACRVVLPYLKPLPSRAKVALADGLEVLEGLARTALRGAPDRQLRAAYRTAEVGSGGWTFAMLSASGRMKEPIPAP